MTNEADRKENSPETPPGEQHQSQSEESALSTRIAELESLLIQKEERLAEANTHLSQLEQVLVSKENEIVRLTEVETTLEERLRIRNNSLAEAVASYKAMVIQANQAVIEELITGETIESINESLSKANTLTRKVREGVQAEILLARVPAGAPERSASDLSALSPREKIQQAIRSFSS